MELEILAAKMLKANRKAIFSDPVQNRSLERGIEVLRAFRPGNDLLGNGEISERTGLSRSTVSRLTQTLVSCGMLEHDLAARAYRLAAPVLGLAHVLRSGSPVLAKVTPLLRKEAQAHRINVGLAAADQDDMIYLESIRYHPRVSLRSVVAGQRVPIRLTSLGRAWLAAIPANERDVILQRYKRRHRTSWNKLERELVKAFASVAEKGYCVATWQPGVVALGAPVTARNGKVYAINMSVSDAVDPSIVTRRLSPLLLRLKTAVESALQDDS